MINLRDLARVWIRPMLVRVALAITLGAVAATTSTAQDVTWVKVLTDNTGTNYMDTASITRVKNGYEVWLKNVLDPPMVVKNPRSSSGTVKICTIREKARFTTTRKWTLRLLVYDQDGQQIEDHVNPPGPGIELIPDTGESVIAKAVLDAGVKKFRTDKGR